MKNKKNLYLSIIIVLTLFLLNASQAQALKQAIFPDSQSLQPIPLPPGGHANISGNINSSVESVPVDDNGQVESETPKIEVAQEVIPTKSNSHTGSYVLWAIVLLLIIVTIFTIYYKNRKNTI